MDIVKYSMSSVNFISLILQNNVFFKNLSNSLYSVSNIAFRITTKYQQMLKCHSTGSQFECTDKNLIQMLCGGITRNHGLLVLSDYVNNIWTLDVTKQRKNYAINTRSKKLFLYSLSIYVKFKMAICAGRITVVNNNLLALPTVRSLHWSLNRQF